MIKLPEMLKKKNTLIILLIVGVLLLVIALPTGSSKNRTEEIPVDTDVVACAYETEMENQLEALLSQIDGAGKVQVLISWKGTSKKLVEKDDKDTVYYNDSSGEQRPFIKQELMPQAEGVVVLAQGGDNALVASQITEAIRALFGVETHKIKIMKGG